MDMKFMMLFSVVSVVD